MNWRANSLTGLCERAVMPSPLAVVLVGRRYQLLNEKTDITPPLALEIEVNHQPAPRGYFIVFCFLFQLSSALAVFLAGQAAARYKYFQLLSRDTNFRIAPQSLHNPSGRYADISWASPSW